MTQRNNLHWGTDTWNGVSNNLNYTYQNNRKTGDGHDADGRVITTGLLYSSYDAVGLIRSYENNQSQTLLLVLNDYDGNGQVIKRVRKTETINDNFPVERENNFYIRSSVFGNEIVTEVNTNLNSIGSNGLPAPSQNGTQRETNVVANGSIIAKQSINLSNTQNVRFQHWEAAGMSYRTTDQTGTMTPSTTNPQASSKNRPVELDAMGGSMGTSTPYVNPPPTGNNDSGGQTRLTVDRPMYVNGAQVTCEMDGIAVEWSWCKSALTSGSATIDITKTSKSTLIGLGITPNYGYRTKEVNHSDDPDTLHFYTDLERYIINYTVSMDARKQTEIGMNISYQRQTGQQPSTTCGSTLDLPDGYGFTTVGALTALIFAEATEYENFVDAFTKPFTTTSKVPQKNGKMKTVTKTNQPLLSGSLVEYINASYYGEMEAIAAVVMWSSYFRQ